MDSMLACRGTGGSARAAQARDRGGRATAAGVERYNHVLASPPARCQSRKGFRRLQMRAWGDSSGKPVGSSDGVPPSQKMPPRRRRRGRKGETIIEFRDVWKAFGSKQVLKGVSFTIKRGEAVGIIGPSGTGKSTVLRLITGLIAPDRGSIFVDGREVGGAGSLLDDAEAAQGESGLSDNLVQLGLVFQNGALFDSLTVKENVGFRLYEHSSLKEPEIRKRVSENLAKVGLFGIEDRYPSELSGGMKKRVALARAITTEASAAAVEVEEVVMFDEPTAGLDPVASTVVEDLIRSIHSPSATSSASSSAAAANSGGVSTYVIVTHQTTTIRRAVDRIIFLHGGRVAWQGTQRQFRNADQGIVQQFKTGSLEGPISYV